MDNRIKIDEKKKTNLSDNPIKSITDNGSVQCVQAVVNVMAWLSLTQNAFIHGDVYKNVSIKKIRD